MKFALAISSPTSDKFGTRASVASSTQNNHRNLWRPISVAAPSGVPTKSLATLLEYLVVLATVCCRCQPTPVTPPCVSYHENAEKTAALQGETVRVVPATLACNLT